MQIHYFPKAPEKNFRKNLYRKHLNICKDLQLSLRSSGTIFTDPQGKRLTDLYRFSRKAQHAVLFTNITILKSEYFVCSSFGSPNGRIFKVTKRLLYIDEPKKTERTNFCIFKIVSFVYIYINLYIY